MNLHPHIQALVASMRRIDSLLAQHGETFWVPQIAAAAGRLAQSDASGLDLFLGMFGGAGSLNEVADQLGGEAEAEIANAYRLAVALRREEDLTRS